MISSSCFFVGLVLAVAPAAVVVVVEQQHWFYSWEVVVADSSSLLTIDYSLEWHHPEEN